MNVSKLSHQFHERKYLTTEGYIKKLQERAEQKLKLPEQLELKFQDRKDSDVIKKFSDLMMQDYEKHKKQLGIENTKKKTNDDEISDEIFAKIHPTYKFKLSELLKGKNNMQQIKQLIFQEKIDSNSKIFRTFVQSRPLLKKNYQVSSFYQTDSFSPNKIMPPSRIMSAQPQQRTRNFTLQTKMFGNEDSYQQVLFYNFPFFFLFFFKKKRTLKKDRNINYKGFSKKKQINTIYFELDNRRKAATSYSNKRQRQFVTPTTKKYQDDENSKIQSNYQKQTFQKVLEVNPFLRYQKKFMESIQHKMVQIHTTYNEKKKQDFYNPVHKKQNTLTYCIFNNISNICKND
eukprot:TRINITY_DN2112_c0_g1_i1.p1 TRINITY_DN2112_c0_g1~~TRINITY_DN2112_c0_g1_i1.p1  ORF type:complete len:345 (-),score=56.19 TRINITY_DN2112_c0_g1_i1:335-1369(-)